MADKSFHAWPFFEDRHRDLAASLENWCARELPPLIEAEHAAKTDAQLDAAARRIVAAFAAGGWLRYAAPEGDHDVRALCLIRETLARRSGLADFCFAMQGLGSAPLALAGDPARRKSVFAEIAAGKRIAAFAVSEPDAGSDVAALKTSARKVGGEYSISGVKTWISNAGLADHYIVFARTGEGPGAKGLSAFFVPGDAPGLKVSARIETVAPHPLGTLVFEDCRVPEAARLGAGGDGFKIAMATLDIFRSTVGAAALGFARRALDEALARTRARLVADKPLAEYQLTQAKLAEMAVRIDAAALLIYRAAWTKDVAKRRVSREAAMAKWFATEAAQEVIDRCVQLHGGAGVVAGSVPERLYREIRALRIYEGTSEVQQLIVAGQTLAAFAAEEEGGKEC